MGTTVDPCFDLSLLHSETEYSRRDVIKRVQSAFLSSSDLHSHAGDVLARDHQASFSTQAPSAEMSGSVVDEWSRVGRIRDRLTVLGTHFQQDQLLFSTILGPVIPADRLETQTSINAFGLLEGFRSDIRQVLRRSPVVEIAMTGWIELELVDRPSRESAKRAYVHSWWRRRGQMTWRCKVPKRCYVLHYHVVGVMITTFGICDPASFTSFFKPSFPWQRSVVTARPTPQKSKAANFKYISRYAWKMGNSMIRNVRPFPEPEELAARARFWTGTGNQCRDFDLRHSGKLLGIRRKWDGTWRTAVKPADRDFLSSVWPA